MSNSRNRKDNDMTYTQCILFALAACVLPLTILCIAAQVSIKNSVKKPSRQALMLDIKMLKKERAELIAENRRLRSDHR